MIFLGGVNSWILNLLCIIFLSGCIPVFLAVAIYFAILYVVEKNKQKGI